jgi:hypothetical protein
MKYTNEEYANMHLTLMKRAEIQLKQNGCMLQGFPAARPPTVILNASCESAHLYLFAYFLLVK